MKTNSLFLALICFLFAFSACKNTNDDEIKYTVPRIKKITNHWNNQLISESIYSYDVAGRIVRESFADDHYIQYTYLPGKVIIKATIPDVEDFPAYPEDLADTLLLNDKGLYMPNSPTYSMEYDAQGYLVKTDLFINKVPNSHTYRIENGNTVQWILRTGNHLENIVMDQVYEFLPNSTNTIGSENLGISFYGKQNENLLAKTTYTSHCANSTYESSETYEYLLDTRKRVTKKSSVENPGNYILYTYYE